MTKTADPKYSQVPLTPSSERPSSNSLQAKHAGEHVGKGSPPTLLLGCKLQPLWRRVRRFPGKPQTEPFMVQQSHCLACIWRTHSKRYMPPSVYSSTIHMEAT